MTGNEGTDGMSAFRFGRVPANPLDSELAVDAYLRECRATGDPDLIRDGEFMAELARAHLAGG